MKKYLPIARKHGYRARTAILDRRVCLQFETDARQAPQASVRLKTVVTSGDGNCYFWFTDRGRAKLIKH